MNDDPLGRPPEDPPLHLLATFQQHFPALQPRWVLPAPGYGVWVAAALDESLAPDYLFISADAGGRALLSWQSARMKQNRARRPLQHWARYPAGVILALGQAEPPLDVGGLTAAFFSQEPHGPRYDFGLGMVTAALVYAVHGHSVSEPDLRTWVDGVRRRYIEAT